MYSIADYGSMIADTVRMAAFERALGLTIAPGSIVVDLGTGTGILALLACRFGARRVYAIEPDDAIQVAREIAAANGYADRIEFVQATSADAVLPERADVIVSDIGGVLPWFQTHILSIADARRRLLAPGGVLIPERDVAWAAVVEAPELHERMAGPWRDRRLGFQMEAARTMVLNSVNRGQVTRDQLLTAPTRWAELDYRTVEDPNVRGRIICSSARAGTGHGLVAGFERTLVDQVRLSSSPDAPDAIRPDHIYGTLFFPWPEPVPVEAGDALNIDLEARLVDEDYIWSWKTRVFDQGVEGREKAHFSQSTFLGAPLSRSRVQKRAASYTPSLGENGRIARFVLDLMAESLTLGDIADRVSARFCQRFPTRQDALSYVGELSRLYG
jgi:protein arginine N-methyltransferase 1